MTTNAMTPEASNATMPADDERPPVAAILQDDIGDVDTLLAAFAAEQRAQGRRVYGLLMRPRPANAECTLDMVLQDIDNGDEYLVSQPLGPGSSGCRADPQGFARASRVLRDALEREPELVICNRYGTLEAARGGFTAELLALLERGIPVLTVVSPKHLASWQHFVGEATMLPKQPAAWAEWLQRVSPAR